MTGSKSILTRRTGILRVMAAVLAGTVVVSLLPGLNAYASDGTEGASGYDMSQYEALLSEFKDELREGGLKNEDEIREAIKEAEDKYGVDISDSDTQKAVDIMNKVNDLGIDGDTLADVVDDVYDNVADKTFETAQDAMDEIEKQVVESAKEAVKETVKKTISDYFKDFWQEIRDFFKGMTESWSN